MKKTSTKYSITQGKTVENVHKWFKREFNRERDFKESFKEQSKLTFNVIHERYTISRSRSFKQNEFLKYRPIYWGFAVLELNKLLRYEKKCDKLKSFFGETNIQ